MMRAWVLLMALVLGSGSVSALEETIRGVLEKSVKPGANAQIKDALGEYYYIIKTDESEKLIAPFAGKNKKVVIVGSAEQREGDPAFYFNLRTIEEYVAKPAASTGKAEGSAPPKQ
jgi:hypothetical protein